MWAVLGQWWDPGRCLGLGEYLCWARGVWGVAAAMGVAAVVAAPAAGAADAVTYDVLADQAIPVMSVEYIDATGRKLLEHVPLPWRLDVTLNDAEGPTGRGAQLRADWRRWAWPGRWVRVNIYSNGELLCQSTLDIGNATCYGNTPHVS
jgi:hypothetical protein